MDQDAQKKLASIALLGLAVLGPVLVAWSGRSQQLLTVPGRTFESLSRNRGSLGSVGSIGAPEAACKLCCKSRDFPLPSLEHCSRVCTSLCLHISLLTICARRLHRLVLQHRCVFPSGTLQVVRLLLLAPVLARVSYVIRLTRDRDGA